MTAQQHGTDPAIGEQRTGQRDNAANQLVQLALSRYRLGATPDGEPYAVPRSGGHVVRLLRSGSTLREELARDYWYHFQRVANRASLADALNALAGMALDEPGAPVHLRVATSDDLVWVDLADPQNRCIRLTAEGWSIEPEPAVLFRRTGLTVPLALPERAGDLNTLWQFVNVAPQDRPIVLAWLVAALITPTRPNPILALFGEQGAGKTSAAKRIAALVDPSRPAVHPPARDDEGWIMTVQSSHIVAFDNLSAVPLWLSDALCRAVTGGGVVRRKKYTDNEVMIFEAQKSLILTGIDVGSLRGDLAERVAKVNLRRIPTHQRRTDDELDRAWQQAVPTILGALLHLASAVLRHRPTVQLDELPRMADFAVTLAAVDAMIGSSGLDHYHRQSRELAEDSLSSEPFIAAVRAHLADQFDGTSGDLLQTVEQPDGTDRAPGKWPRNSRRVTQLLKLHAPALREAGWIVTDDAGQNHDGIIRWHIRRP